MQGTKETSESAYSPFTKPLAVTLATHSISCWMNLVGDTSFSANLTGMIDSFKSHWGLRSGRFYWTSDKSRGRMKTTGLDRYHASCGQLSHTEEYYCTLSHLGEDGRRGNTSITKRMTSSCSSPTPPLNLVPAVYLRPLQITVATVASVSVAAVSNIKKISRTFFHKHTCLLSSLFWLNARCRDEIDLEIEFGWSRWWETRKIRPVISEKSYCDCYLPNLMPVPHPE